MNKYLVEVPIVAFLIIEVKGEDSDDAAMSIPDDCVYKTASGGLAVAGENARISLSLDAFNWSRASIEEIV